MFHPDWHVLILLAAAWLFGYIWAWAFARHRQMVSNAQWSQRLRDQHAVTVLWLIDLFGRQHGLNERYAALTVANRNAGLGPALAAVHNLSYNARECRYYIARPRQAEEPEPQVDLREDKVIDRDEA